MKRAHVLCYLREAVWCLLLPVLLVLRWLLLLVHLLGFVSLYFSRFILFNWYGRSVFFSLSSIFLFCLLHRQRLNSELSRVQAYAHCTQSIYLLSYYSLLLSSPVFVRKKWASLFICRNENKAKNQRDNRTPSKPNNNRTGNESKNITATKKKTSIQVNKCEFICIWNRSKQTARETNQQQEKVTAALNIVYIYMFFFWWQSAN